MRFGLLALISGLVAALPAHSKVYRCEDAQGNVAFKDQPCETQQGDAIDVENNSAKPDASQRESIGFFTAGDKTLTLKHHVFDWDEKSGELTVFLTPTKLSESERRDIREGQEFYFAVDQDKSPGLPQWDRYPYAVVKLRFDPEIVAIDNLADVKLIAVGIKNDKHTGNVGPLPEKAKKNFDALRLRDGKLSMSYRGDWQSTISDGVDYEWSISF